MKEVATLKGATSKPRLKRKPLYWQVPVISALLTGLLFLCLCLMSDKYPLGTKTFTVSDLEAQYAPFLFFYKRKLENLNFSNLIADFTYSTELGMGKNTMGTFGYYLASPFNLLVLFFRPEQVSLFIGLLIGLKLSFASMFMTIFIHERMNDEFKTSKWPILFGVMYAFSSYTVIYMINIMWLDAYLALPLLLYFIERYIKDDKHLGIIITLIYMFTANYYVAYMAGIFSFIYLLVRLYEVDKLHLKKDNLAVVGRFILLAVLCALTVCVILLPVALDTLGNTFPEGAGVKDDYVSFATIDIFDQLFMGCPGDFAKVLPGNLPFVFVSTLTTLFCTIYFVSDAFKGKIRKLHLACFIGIYLSVSINAIDYAWHIFDKPNWFWHRQTFVFIPFFLIITLKVLENLKQVTAREIYKSMGILLGLLIIAQSFGRLKTHESLFLINAGLVIGLSVIVANLHRTKWPNQLRNMNKLLPFILALIVVVETSFLSALTSSGVAGMSVYNGDGLEHAKSIVLTSDMANASDMIASGYRFEIENTNPGDDHTAIDDNGALYCGYNGISLFNSNSNKSLHKFMKQLGFTTNYNHFSLTYSCSSLDTDTFLSIGSLSTRNDYSDAIFVAEDSYGFGQDFYFYPGVFQIGMAADKEALDFDFYKLETEYANKDYFAFRNEWYKSLFPDAFLNDYFISFDAGEPVVLNAQEINMSNYTTYTESYNQSLYEKNKVIAGYDDNGIIYNSGIASDYTHTLHRMNKSVPIVIEYTFNAPNIEELYINISAVNRLNECEVYVNGSLYRGWSEASFYSPILRLGSFEPGEQVVVSILSDADKFEYLDINFAYFDSEIFNLMMTQVDKVSVNTLVYEDGHAKFQTNLKEGDMLLTTIPYEKGWTAYIDGKKADIIAYQDALIAIDVGTGDHIVELKYEAPGLKIGAVLSVIGIIGLVAFEVIYKRKSKK